MFLSGKNHVSEVDNITHIVFHDEQDSETN